MIKYEYYALFIFCLFVWGQVCVYIAQVGFKLYVAEDHLELLNS